MKKFTKIFICLILCVFCLGLVACSKKDNFVYPSANDTTYSNGGLVVKKGNYIYFVNGYLSASDMKKKNDTYTVGALMVAKLDDAGNLILDEDGLLDDEYYTTISSKLCGFEATNLYIFGDYLYFTSPSQEDEAKRNIPAGEEEKWAKTRVVFYRIKLNKSGKVEKLYTSEVSNSQLEYAYYNYNNSTYLLVYEKDKSIEVKIKDTNRLLRVNASSKNVSTIATEVENVLMPDENVKNSHENIFYTLKDSKTSKNFLHRLNVITGKDEDFELEDEITLKFVRDGYLFFTERQEFASGTNLCYSLINEDVTTPIVLWKNVQTLSNYYISEDGDAIIGVSNNNLEIRWKWWSKEVQTFNFNDENGVNFIGFANTSFVYYDSNNTIKAIDYTDGSEAIAIATLDDVNTDYFDCNWDYLYFYKTVGSNSYLFRLRINNNAEMVSEEMVGVYLEKDIPKEEA